MITVHHPKRSIPVWTFIVQGAPFSRFIYAATPYLKLVQKYDSRIENTAKFSSNHTLEANDDRIVMLGGFDNYSASITYSFHMNRAFQLMLL